MICKIIEMVICFKIYYIYRIIYPFEKNDNCHTYTTAFGSVSMKMSYL